MRPLFLCATVCATLVIFIIQEKGDVQFRVCNSKLVLIAFRRSKLILNDTILF